MSYWFGSDTKLPQTRLTIVSYVIVGLTLLLLVGFWSAMRRAELSALAVEHVSDVPDGIAILIPRSKTDQEKRGQTIGLARRADELCPAAALRRWLEVAGIKSGPVFRGLTARGQPRVGALSPGKIGAIVKELAGAAGLEVARFGAHSLRSGFVTEAYRQGIPEEQIQAQTRHRNVKSLRGYRQIADPVERGGTKGMGGGDGVGRDAGGEGDRDAGPGAGPAGRAVVDGVPDVEKIEPP